MKKAFPIIGGLLLLGIVGAYFLLVNRQQSEPEVVTPRQTVVNLSEYSESGQSGGAILTQSDGMLNVELNLEGLDSEVPQPAHIHTGLCPRIGPVIFSLNDVVGGKSVTQLDTTLEGLLASSEELNVNVHESYDNFSTYTACGDIQ